MLKLRQAQYCNFKLFLIFLVVYAHLIEPRIYQSNILMIQYRCIYLVHMPLFSFLTGLFLQNSKSCQKQLLRLFPLYTLLQMLAVIITNGEVRPLTPYWHLWYLLSCSIWLGFAWLWFRFCRRKYKIIILIFAVAIGCALGYISFIGRTLSLSRTIVFFPYFWLGLISDPKIHWRKLRPYGVTALVAAVILTIMVWPSVSTAFLYHAAPYGAIKNGAILRLICYLLAGLFGFSVLTLMPTKRFSFTKVGTDTMPAYLIHAPFVLLVKRLEILWPWYVLIVIAFLCFTHKLLRWNSKLYAIVCKEEG